VAVKKRLRFGIASRPASDMVANGDAYVIEEWNGQTLLVVIDGLGHGEEASTASKNAKDYILENHAMDIEQIVLGLHKHLRETRGAVAELVRIDRVEHRLLFCGIGNAEVRIVSEPPMHPVSLDGILGMNLRKVRNFQYSYNSLRAVVLHSDGISSRFDLSDYPLIFEQPQEVAEHILAKWGLEYDDAIIIIAVEDTI
jgi:serine/threonine protein phosphatase PrpC